MSRPRIRGVVVYRKADVPLVQSHDRPKADSFDRAERELQRLDIPDATRSVDRLRAGQVEKIPAAELVRRMAGRALPDVSAPRVQREIDRIRDGKRLRPVLAAGDTVADGEHRLCAVHHLDPTAPVAVIRTTGSNEKRKGTPVSKIQKTSIQSAADRAAIAQCAERLEQSADPASQGLASKLRSAIQGSVLPDDGTGLSTAMLDGATTTQYRTSAEKFEDAHTRMFEASKRDDLDPRTREAVRKTRRDLDREYLAKASPEAFAALEAQAAHGEPYIGHPVPVVGDDAEIRKAAEKLRKADSSLTPYEALERAYKAARAA